jgi:hypothetical protein
MMRRMRRIALALALLLVLVAVGTYVAGEQTEVAVLRTFDADGTAHATKLWVVDLDGTPWVRVANPRRSWFQRLREYPDVDLVRGGVGVRVRAVVISDPTAQARVDAAFADKYGAVDRWYGLLLRRNPVAVRLDPVAGPREASR